MKKSKDRQLYIMRKCIQRRQKPLNFGDVVKENQGMLLEVAVKPKLEE